MLRRLVDHSTAKTSADPKNPLSNRPYLHVFEHSDEVEETGIISLSGVNVENDPHKESLLGVGAPY